MVKKKKKDKLMITLVVLDFLVLVGFFITYGPISYFRNLLITTAMTTRTHQYLAYIFLALLNILLSYFYRLLKSNL